MSKGALAFGFLLLLGSAPAARGGTITIEFDLTDSTISILDFISVPPDGSFRVGSAIVRIPGDGISSPSPGAATLASFVWSFTFSAQYPIPPYLFTFTGYAFLRGLEEATGTLTGGLANLLFGRPARYSLGIFIDCEKPEFLCNLPGNPFPYSTRRTGSTPPGIFGVGNLDRPGLATIRMTSISPGYYTGRIVGREVNRFFPEPSRDLLALAGIGAVLSLGLWRRLLRRRNRSELPG